MKYIIIGRFTVGALRGEDGMYQPVVSERREGAGFSSYAAALRSGISDVLDRVEGEEGPATQTPAEIESAIRKAALRGHTVELLVTRKNGDSERIDVEAYSLINGVYFVYNRRSQHPEKLPRERVLAATETPYPFTPRYAVEL